MGRDADDGGELRPRLRLEAGSAAGPVRLQRGAVLLDLPRPLLPAAGLPGAPGRPGLLRTVPARRHRSARPAAGRHLRRAPWRHPVIRRPTAARQRPRRRPTPRGTTAAVLVATLGLGGGCGLQLEDVPMPSLVDGPTYAITVEFADALNLPVDAPVKLDGATVGQVTAVEAGDYLAEVELAVSEDVELRATSSAEIRLTSPMGTAFVQLLPGRRGDLLADGDAIDVAATGTAPDITDLLSSLSTVVTGGSFGDIATIIDEVNVALTGNAGDVRRLLGRLDTAVSDLNDEFGTLDRLTRSLNRLTVDLADDLPTITASLTDLSDLVTVLERQRTRMMRTLGSLNRFETTATPFTRAVREDAVASLADMTTVLTSLVGSSEDITGVLEGLAAFAKGSDEAAPGDFANFDLTFLLDLEALLSIARGDEPPITPSEGER
ncbi:MCE family protein [Nocardioides sp. BGMRC 2183]|nr:MCE family protein [Nocardioides sp. BGMRC 2183]